MSGAQLPRPGDMIAGKYVLDRLLGQGGMGAVFAARHLKLSKAVAIKIMLADASSPEASQRFINEGRAAANIQNEHVVRVDDVDEEMGYAYMVLELLEGEDLAQVLEKDPAKRLPPHVAVGFVLQGCRGVMQAHAIGIVHRDLKPSNLFLARRPDGSQVVKVLDFGISKAQGSSALAASPNALTSTKAMLGSPLYMSPEQLRNAKSVDHRADIWAMGVILYELITGQLPFMGDNLGELFAAILETDAQPLSARVPGIPMGLDDVVLRCLQRKPEQRFQSVAELVAALAPFERPLPPMPMAHKGGGTAFLPGGVNMSPQAHTTGGAQSSAALPQQRISTAGQVATGPHLPHGAITPNTPAGVALPAGFNQTTGSGWQTGGVGAPPPIPKSKAPIVFAAVGGAVVVLAIVAGVVITRRNGGEAKDVPPPPATSSVAVALEPPPTKSAEVIPEPPAAPASASASAAVESPSAAPPASAPPPVAKPALVPAPVVHAGPPPSPKPAPAPVPPPTAPKPTPGKPLEVSPTR